MAYKKYIELENFSKRKVLKINPNSWLIIAGRKITLACKQGFCNIEIPTETNIIAVTCYGQDKEPLITPVFGSKTLTAKAWLLGLFDCDRKNSVGEVKELTEIFDQIYNTITIEGFGYCVSFFAKANDIYWEPLAWSANGFTDETEFEKQVKHILSKVLIPENQISDIAC